MQTSLIAPDKEETFAIDARSCTLLGSEKSHGILNGKNYEIPIYQRPYSWNSEQIRRLFKGIINAYLNEQEPYFLGTVQLMPNKNIFEIVDGQQRLTTLVLFFKLLQLKEPSLLLNDLKHLNWLKTVVNNGKQQLMLGEVLTVATLEEIKEMNLSLNKYAANLLTLNEILDEYLTGEQDQTFLIDTPFINYIGSKLYFVVIETRAGLAKTLDIFNTINTAGMDLNGGDVFKIQMFEYLTRIRKQENGVFDEIDQLYSEIDIRNTTAGRKVCDIQFILGIYKHILIEKCHANRALHELGTSTFFERLFSTLLIGEKQKNFDKSKFENALDLKPLRKLIEVRFLWDDKNFNSFRNRTWTYFTWWSRYGRHWVLDFIYLYQFYTDENSFRKEAFIKFRELLAKFYFIQSVRFQRVVNESHTFTYDLMRKILNGSNSEEDIINMLREKINRIKEYDVNFKKNHLTQDIFHISRKRDLICWLLAILDEDALNDNQLNERFFKGDIHYDVEHIHPRNPELQTLEEKKEWAPVLNTVGNLILLERKINRSVSNRKFDDKSLNDKRIGYKESQLLKVQTFLFENPAGNWTVERCKARTEYEADRIMNFLFSDGSVL